MLRLWAALMGRQARIVNFGRGRSPVLEGGRDNSSLVWGNITPYNLAYWNRNYSGGLIAEDDGERHLSSL